MRDKVPTSKVTSTKDVLLQVYYLVKYSEEQERLASEGSEPKSKTDDESLLEIEALEQNRQFEHAILGVEEIPEMTSEQVFALYLSAIRLVDSLELIVPKTIEDKEKLLELLESQIAEFTTRKKIDQLLQQSIERTSSKKKEKRVDSKGIHQLIKLSNEKMKEFEKSASETITQEPPEPAPQATTPTQRTDFNEQEEESLSKDLDKFYSSHDSPSSQSKPSRFKRPTSARRAVRRVKN